MFDRPNRLGTSLNVNLIRETPMMKPQDVVVEADRMLQLIADRSQHAAIRQSFTPYDVLRAEACERQQDDACVRTNANAI
jgi:hypothetical protein